jgi:hypothetical protein
MRQIYIIFIYLSHTLQYFFLTFLSFFDKGAYRLITNTLQRRFLRQAFKILK